jgi:hypothetical protein
VAATIQSQTIASPIVPGTGKKRFVRGCVFIMVRRPDAAVETDASNAEKALSTAPGCRTQLELHQGLACAVTSFRRRELPDRRVGLRQALLVECGGQLPCTIELLAKTMGEKSRDARSPLAPRRKCYSSRISFLRRKFSELGAFSCGFRRPWPLSRRLQLRPSFRLPDQW